MITFIDNYTFRLPNANMNKHETIQMQLLIIAHDSINYYESTI